MHALLAGIALFLGEVLIIGAEMWAAKYFATAESQLRIILYAFGISVVGVVLLVYGYTFGYQAFKNIWIVTAISISGILVVEPLVAWFLFREIPTLGAGIALALAILGIILTLTLK